MSRRNRARSRSRREAVAARRAVGPRPPERELAPRIGGFRARGSVPRSGYSRAVGAPSASLERAAVLERGFVVKDFRRLAVTVVIVLVLLVASGIVVNLTLR